MPTNDFSIDEIKNFAQEQHDGQQRKFSNETYYEGHCAQVLRFLEEIGATPAQKAAGLTHDVIEDTLATYEDVEGVANTAVADMVQEVTSSDDDVKEKGKTKYLADEMAQMSAEALTVKLADRLSNVSDLEKTSRHFRDRYTRETSVIINRIRRDRDLNEKHHQLIERIVEKIRPFL